MKVPITNCLTIDVEDYFQVSNFSKVIKVTDWNNFECRAEDNTLYLLDLLSTFDVKTTFFILGWIAERYPNLVKKIQKEGHEIASHGYWHQLIQFKNRRHFREDVRKSKELLEDITGESVLGYRAPSYSITKKTLWALEILKDEGFMYDSSILPICHSRFGNSDIPRFPFIVNGNTLDIFSKSAAHVKGHCQSINDADIKLSKLRKERFIIEFPVSTMRLFSHNIPVAGGGYFRLYPYRFTKWGFKRLNQKENRPFIFYIHPWELDINQPRIKNASNFSKFRHYINLDKTEDKLKRLLSDFHFSTVKDVLNLLS